MKINTIVFDLGGVLIDWNPRYVFRDLMPDETEMEWFLTNICTSDWNAEQDRGRLLTEATQILQAQHPQFADLIAAFYGQWEKMIGGEISHTVELLRLVQASNYHTYALTNWSAETFPIAQQRFDFLHSFKGIVVSGEEKLIKPDPEIFEVLIERYSLNPSQSIFIDDNAQNIETARKIGFQAIHFLSPQQLATDLKNFGVY